MGRPKGSKNKKKTPNKIITKKTDKLTTIAAVNFKTLEFIGIYNNPTHAAKVLFDQSAYNARIRMCAENKTSQIKGITFVWVNDANGFTTETIQEVIQTAKEKKLFQKKPLSFNLKIINKMTNEDYLLLNKLHNKYTTEND